MEMDHADHCWEVSGDFVEADFHSEGALAF